MTEGEYFYYKFSVKEAGHTIPDDVIEKFNELHKMEDGVIYAKIPMKDLEKVKKD